MSLTKLHTFIIVIYSQPDEFFLVGETLPLHGSKFVPDIETHGIHPTVEGLIFNVQLFQIVVWLRQELRVSLCVSVCLAQSVQEQSNLRLSMSESNQRAIREYFESTMSIKIKVVQSEPLSTSSC